MGRSSINIDYEYEPTRIPYEIQHNYSPDFLLPNGVYLECKGYWDSIDRRKVKNVVEQHPEIDLRMVFQAPYNKISKKSKERSMKDLTSSLQPSINKKSKIKYLD